MLDSRVFSGIRGDPMKKPQWCRRRAIATAAKDRQ
jgi:hypothetical protein